MPAAPDTAAASGAGPFGAMGGLFAACAARRVVRDERGGRAGRGDPLHGLRQLQKDMARGGPDPGAVAAGGSVAPPAGGSGSGTRRPPGGPGGGGAQPPGRRRRRRGRHRLLKASVIVVAVLVLIAAGGYGYVEYKLGEIRSAHCTTCAAQNDSKPYNVLLVGSDSRAGDTGSAAQHYGSASQVPGQRSDTIKIVHVDPQAGTARVLSIPRDTFVTLSGMNPASGLSSENKINTAFNDGPDALVATIQNTLGIPIAHYVTIDFSGVVNLVNAVGGIKLDFPYPARDDDNGNNNSGLTIPSAGCQTLNGTMALALSRSRFYQWYQNGSWHADPTSDLGRITRQNILIEAVIAKVKHSFNPITLNNVLSAVVPDITKDNGLSGNGLIALAQKYHAFTSSDLQTWTLPTVPATVPLYGDVLLVDEQQAAAVVQQFLGGLPPLPVTTPPLDSYGRPQAPPPSTTTTAPATGTAPSASTPAGQTPSTSTTAPPSVPYYDPTPC